MGPFDYMLAILALLIIAGALIYTYKVGRQTSASPSEMDSEISEKVQEHYVLRNPIFVACIVGAVLILLYIGYVALTTSW
ncbi:hypothetical protein [Sutcliffiella halmapala]|uniref:hypothetical protein n=1 Tax=Sutcliffiella halmapala TaxID=79882 RepID=UPI0009951C34|nr:hypothetical protein [Sutcliffiella halmapala]